MKANCYLVLALFALIISATGCIFHEEASDITIDYCDDCDYYDARDLVSADHYEICSSTFSSRYCEYCVCGGYPDCWEADMVYCVEYACDIDEHNMRVCYY